jgi:hypothetical protein
LVSYHLKRLLPLFDAIVVLSYGYALSVHLAAGTLLPRLPILPIAAPVPQEACCLGLAMNEERTDRLERV